MIEAASHNFNVRDKGIVDRYWDAMKLPTLPTQFQNELTFRVMGHYHTPSILGSVLDTIRMCPQHKFLLSSNDPETVLSAPDNCLVMLRANIYDPTIPEYLTNCRDLGLTSVLNIQGGVGGHVKDPFDGYFVSGFKFAYLRNVIRWVHSLPRTSEGQQRPVYVEEFVDTVRLSKMPEQIRCRELPKNFLQKADETWHEKIESLFTSQRTEQTPSSRRSTSLVGT